MRILFSLKESSTKVKKPFSIEKNQTKSKTEFLNYIEGRYGRIDSSELQRLRHGHGQTAQEVYLLRYASYKRLPDVVIWPVNHDQVVFLLEAAKKFDVCIIPYGGGTTVSEALLCPENESRMIVSLGTPSYPFFLPFLSPFLPLFPPSYPSPHSFFSHSRTFLLFILLPSYLFSPLPALSFIHLSYLFFY